MKKLNNDFKYGELDVTVCGGIKVTLFVGTWIYVSKACCVERTRFVEFLRIVGLWGTIMDINSI